MAMTHLMQRGGAFTQLGRCALRVLLQGVEQQQRLPWHVLPQAHNLMCNNNKAAAVDGLCPPIWRWMSSEAARNAEGALLRVAPDGNNANADEEMLTMIKSEIKRETDVGNTEDINRVPPSPFTMHEEPGVLEVVLHRKYELEDISIRCIYSSGTFPNDSDDEVEEQEILPEMVHMIVSVSKGVDEPVLELSCLTNGEELHIERVSCAKEQSSSHYAPEFVDLKENLQHQFNQFLKIRGINQEFCGYLMTLMPEKERQEYIGWLKRIESFVRS
ncbi:hypothetical protein O6H91_22G065200 [Diphasiastrum complanatum]|uniref:Uncharacterized protein n=1 Tax=Diphasiastrum complanatum TaxID=34168 RepID=A0ACC2AGG2_DIPCM|nr:hypothetical protein O6H91_22G065200 [Diphasiastrum complanatum]